MFVEKDKDGKKNLNHNQALELVTKLENYAKNLLILKDKIQYQKEPLQANDSELLRFLLKYEKQ